MRERPDYCTRPRLLCLAEAFLFRRREPRIAEAQNRTVDQMADEAGKHRGGRSEIPGHTHPQTQRHKGQRPEDPPDRTVDQTITES